MAAIIACCMKFLFRMTGLEPGGYVVTLAAHHNLSNPVRATVSGDMVPLPYHAIILVIINIFVGTHISAGFFKLSA